MMSISMSTNVSRREWIWVFVAAGIILSLASLPYISAYPFFGMLTLAHFSAMLAALIGQVLFFMLYLRQRRIWHTLRSKIAPLFGAMLIWLLLALILTYLPVTFQRRFLFGIMIPLAIFSARGISQVLLPVLNRISSPRLEHIWRSAIWFIVSLTVMSSLYLSFGGMMYVSARPEKLYDSNYLVEIADWFNENVDADDILLTSELTGKMLGPRTGLTTYIGHPIETLEFEKKQDLLESFYAGEMDNEEHISWLESTRAQWLVYGPAERALGDFPNDETLLELIFTNQEYAIYRVLP